MSKTFNFKHIAIAIAALALIILLFGGRSAEKTAKQYMEAIMSGDASKCASLMTDEFIDDTDAPTKKVFISELDSELDNMIDSYKGKYGKKWKFSVDVVDVYDYDSSSSENVKAAEVKITHKGSSWLNDDAGEENETLILVKKGLKWYVDDIH